MYRTKRKAFVSKPIKTQIQKPSNTYTKGTGTGSIKQPHPFSLSRCFSPAFWRTFGAQAYQKAHKKNKYYKKWNAKKWLIMRLFPNYRKLKNENWKTPILKATGSTPAGCTSEKALISFKKSRLFFYVFELVIAGFGDCFGDYCPFFAQKNRRMTAADHAFRASSSAREIASVARLLESIRAWASGQRGSSAGSESSCRPARIRWRSSAAKSRCRGFRGRTFYSPSLSVT